jgi:mono/diheme cytochrome c family protein
MAIYQTPKSLRCVFAFLCALLGSSVAIAQEEASEGEQLFVRRIAPLLREKCIACHGATPAKIEGSLDLRSYEGMMRGGDSELPAVRLTQSDESPLLLAVLGNHESWSAMPPKESERLTETQVAWLRQWIRLGATWPSDARQKEINQQYTDEWSLDDGITVKTAGGLDVNWSQRKYKPSGLWAYRPVRKPDVPVDNPSQAIDWLVRQRLPAGVVQAPAADAIAFIRRATFDLTGLPPTPSEVSAFKKAYEINADLAVSHLIDRLLDSPHYGERMAQHWLDVVRYADSSGFANDYERGNAWRYRDYVIRAFNRDLPFDQFIQEQIAGDEIDQNNPENLIAVGFLRMGPWELTGMEVAKVARQRFLDDVTNSVGETFLAHSLQCARCHDHKFDPVPTRDYYAIQAVFFETQLVERPAAFLPGENTQGFEEREYLLARQAEFEKTLVELRSKVTLETARAWFLETTRDPTEFEKAVEEIGRSNGSSENKSALAAVRKRMQEKEIHPDLIPPPNVGFTPQDFGMERVARKGLERLKWELDRYEPVALSVYNGPTPQVKSVLSPSRLPKPTKQDGEPEKACILIGGDPFSLGDMVSPGILSVVSHFECAPLPSARDGRRLAFAKWIADARNPLTTRSIVNRIWMWHYGDPIAGNPNNFGSTGKPPTHPELLDWLASEFVDHGWSFKWMHRSIMNSQSYRMATRHPQQAELREHDPLGVSLACFKPRRLSAEELRDAMLFVSGELNPTLGGIPSRPEINAEAAMQPRQVMGTFASAWIPNPLPGQRHRRSIYTLKLRGLVDPALEVFNLPTPDFSCERREVSAVTPQVFALFNSRSSHLRSLALAHRIVSQNLADHETIQALFQAVLSRPADANEVTWSMAHWKQMEGLLRESKPVSEKPPTRIRRNAVEENTGETFSFEETLHSNRDFVPDLQPDDVDLRTRAFAELCLVLFNSNEFSYVE